MCVCVCVCVVCVCVYRDRLCNKPLFAEKAIVATAQLQCKYYDFTTSSARGGASQQGGSVRFQLSSSAPHGVGFKCVYSHAQQKPAFFLPPPTI